MLAIFILTSDSQIRQRPLPYDSGIPSRCDIARSAKPCLTAGKRLEDHGGAKSEDGRSGAQHAETVSQHGARTSPLEIVTIT